jgi:hypothetical protein
VRENRGTERCELVQAERRKAAEPELPLWKKIIKVFGKVTNVYMLI